jgi:hypothetical protein
MTITRGMTRVYVAGSWVERHARAAPMVVRLCQAGLTITHDWAHEGDAEKIKCSDCDGTGFASDGRASSCLRCSGTKIATPTDKDRSPEYRRKHAQAELSGVRDADVVWIMTANGDYSVGSWVELGAALAYHRELIVSGKNCNRTIFTELALKRFETDEEAFEWIIKQ